MSCFLVNHSSSLFIFSPSIMAIIAALSSLPSSSALLCPLRRASPLAREAAREDDTRLTSCLAKWVSRRSKSRSEVSWRTSYILGFLNKVLLSPSKSQKSFDLLDFVEELLLLVLHVRVFC